jgi:hypothetical protein
MRANNAFWAGAQMAQADAADLSAIAIARREHIPP